MYLKFLFRFFLEKNKQKKRYRIFFERNLESYEPITSLLTEESRDQVQFIDSIPMDHNFKLLIIYGGDGTLFWGHKQFGEAKLPPVVIFDGVRLYFIQGLSFFLKSV